MNLFEVLSKDARIIVFSSEEDSLIYTWNQSLTLQCWGWYSSDGGQVHWWDEVDIRTLAAEPRNYKEARRAAIAWHATGETKA